MERIEVIKAVADNLGDLVVDSTPASLTGSTIDILDLIHPESQQLRGYTCYLHGSGHPATGQERTITNFDPTNDRITTRGFTTIPSSNTNVLVFQSFRKKRDYDAAVNRLIGQVKLRYLEESVATMQLVGSQYEYAVPSGFEYVSNLRLVPSGHSDYESDDEVDAIFELPPRYWRVEPDSAGTYYIIIDPRKISIDASLDEEWVRVIGQVKPDISPTDNASVPVELEEYIISGATAVLASRKIREKNEWMAKFKYFRDEQLRLEDYVYRPRLGTRVG